MTHSDPNLAQVPAARAPYGHECRSLFGVAPGMKLVGCDAEGLELRMLGHYLAKHDGGDYANTVVNGKREDGTDVHTVNQRIVGLNSRDSAKTFIYAYLYGAGAFKLGTVIVDDMTEAARTKFYGKHKPGSPRERATARLGLRAKKRIEEGLPALGKVQQAVQRAAHKKVLRTVDGGILRVRSAHAALNTLLQGGGAVVLKKALVILADKLEADGWVFNPLTGVADKGGLRFGFVANVHDEWQMECSESCAEEIGKMAADAMREAGEAYNLRCPLAGSFGLGSTWAETH